MTTIVSKFKKIALFFFAILFLCIRSAAQKTTDTQLEKWPVDLETDFALSSLPKHLQSGATVYLLDPQKGYYVGRQGSNGFIPAPRILNPESSDCDSLLYFIRRSYLRFGR